MSLNGLDDAKVKEAHDAAIAEPGGWYEAQRIFSFPRLRLATPASSNIPIARRSVLMALRYCLIPNC